jgi:hypothetical protein
MTTAIYSLADFLDDLTRRATLYTPEGGGPHIPYHHNAGRLRLTKRQLMRMCYDTLENIGALDCNWCGIDTGEIGEFYMVTDDLWDRYGCGDGMACIGCLERSMGRRLQPDDFITPDFSREDHMSDRLRDRRGIDIADATPQP